VSEPMRTADSEQQTVGQQTADRQASTKPLLLMVAGPGRSGTSAVTGALSQLGVHVPPPLVDWNRSNKRGFFESRWVVDFQRKVLNRAHTYEFDADPRAIARIAEVADPKTRQQLTDWLKDAAKGHQQLVIKDPRSVWLHELWIESVDTCGLSISYLTMLRHPTEVAGSRSTYYGTASDERQARDYAISKVAGWINVSLLNERQTRGQSRVYLRYTDLLSDWRTALGGVRDRVGLEFNADLEPGKPNPVDDFISPELHRIRTGWDELDVPAELKQIAEEVWAACERLADEGGDADVAATFDALAERYDRLYRDAAAIAHDTQISAASRASSESAAKTRKELQRKLSEAKSAVAAAERKAANATSLRTRATSTVQSGAKRATRFGRRAVRAARRRIGAKR
jgi:hypothetical protein